MAALSDPPTFQNSVNPFVVDFSEPQHQEPPPEFSLYHPEYFTQNSNIVSHDRHLNEDGEALYRFLLSQAAHSPTFILHCRGTHIETRTRLASSPSREQDSRDRTETVAETIVDFDFSIDIGHLLLPGPIQWSIADPEATHRGSMVREVDQPTSTRKATRNEISRARLWKHERNAKGLPPWVGKDSLASGSTQTIEEQIVLKSSRTLRQWADDYCSSKKYLKEFTYEKVVYGWNFDSLEAAIRSAIQSINYSGSVTVEFNLSGSKICIRPDNRLSRALSNAWLTFILFVFLLYPLIWLYKRFHHLGGGRWEVCGAAYALKRFEALDRNSEVNSSDTPESSSSPRLSKTGRLVGTREGEWFKQWEATIKTAVANRLQNSKPMTRVDGHPTEAALSLDGYADAWNPVLVNGTENTTKD